LKLLSDEARRIVGFENGQMKIEFDREQGFRIKSWSPAGMDPIPLLSDAFEAEIEGTVYRSSQFVLERVEHAADVTQQLVTVHLREPERPIRARLCFIQERDESVRLIIQFSVTWENNEPKETFMRLPFLARMRLEANLRPTYYFPSRPAAKLDGASAVEAHRDFPLPLGIVDAQGKHGFSVDFPTLNELWFPWAQNRNADFYRLSSQDELLHHRIRLRPNAVLADTFELHVHRLRDGWTELFEAWRERVRGCLDLGDYRREDLRWSRDALLHHFTYIYGKEAYDYDGKKLDVERIVKQGNEFGGYDSILIWHQYPRLGVDRRDQWDFFTDYPGGIAGLRETVDRAHSQGLKVFLPFKPWDVGYHDSPSEITESIARLVEQSDVDGIFLDTMDSVPKHFRAAIDRVKPGVVFFSEMHPSRLRNIQLVTASWNQFGSDGTMPEIDLLRFVLPEHPSPVIARWHVGERKDTLIRRAVFNGTGIVIWQDIFGSWLPYSAGQKETIRRWKSIWQSNKPAYSGSRPIPYYPTLRPGLYCNLFRSDDGTEAVFTFYNATEHTIEGELTRIGRRPARLLELWRRAQADVTAQGEEFALIGAVPPGELALYKATFGGDGE